MTQLQIVCNNCGAKYRLPETFQNDHAKCKQCGSVIDVSAQRQSAAAGTAPAAPAAARPAAARPARTATARSEASEGKPAAIAHTERPSRRHRGDDKVGEEGGEAHGRHGRHGHHEHAEKKGGMGVAVGSGIGLLAIVIVGVLWYMNSGSAPAKTDAAQAPAVEPGKAAAKPADATAEKGTQKPQDATIEKPSEKPIEKPVETPKPEAQKTPEAAKPAAPVEPELPAGSPAWMKSKITSMDQVFDPKTLTPVAWPAAVTAEQQKQVDHLLDDIREGGKHGIGAKKELEELAWVGFAGIVNRLREVDYKDPEQSMFAFELNKILENVTVSLNTGFAVVNADENIDPRKVDFNAKTAKAWQGILTRFPTPEALAEHRKKALADKNKK